MSIRRLMDALEFEHSLLVEQRAHDDLERARKVAALGEDIETLLRDRIAELRTQRQRFVEQRRVQHMADELIREAAGPAMRAAMQEMFRLQESIADLKRRIKCFDADIAARRARLVGAGVTSMDIEAVPSFRDAMESLPKLSSELEVTIARYEELSALIAKGPRAFVSAEAA